MMRTKSTAIVLTGIMALFSSSAFAASMPAEIFQPRDAEVVTAERQNDGEFEAEFRLKAQQHDVAALAEQIRQHAQHHGFTEMESEIKREDVDLKFKRGSQELEVSIEQKAHGMIEYKADLDASTR